MPGVTASIVRRDGNTSAVSTRCCDISAPRVLGRLDDGVVCGEDLVSAGVGEHGFVGHEAHLASALALLGEVLAYPHRAVEHLAGRRKTLVDELLLAVQHALVVEVR